MADPLDDVVLLHCVGAAIQTRLHHVAETVALQTQTPELELVELVQLVRLVFPPVFLLVPSVYCLIAVAGTVLASRVDHLDSLHGYSTIYNQL